MQLMCSLYVCVVLCDAGQKSGAKQSYLLYSQYQIIANFKYHKFPGTFKSLDITKENIITWFLYTHIDNFYAKANL